MVVDTSALLAYVLSQPLEDWVYHQLSANLTRLHMSTVNYTEALICISDRYPAAKNVVADLVESDVKRALTHGLVVGRSVRKHEGRFAREIPQSS